MLIIETIWVENIRIIQELYAENIIKMNNYSIDFNIY
jgi:hypothetical protein